MKINPDTEAVNVVAYCRDCKTENHVDIHKGQCFESRSRLQRLMRVVVGSGSFSLTEVDYGRL